MLRAMHPAIKILLGILVAVVLLVGGCTVAVWSLFAPEPGASERRDAVRAAHGALARQLAQTAQGAVDLAAAGERLRAIELPPDVLGLSLWQGDSEEHRITLRRDFDGRQSRRVVINGAGSVTLVDAQGADLVFDLLETDSTLADGRVIEIELVLSRAPLDGPE